MGYDMRLYVVEKFNTKGFTEEVQDKRHAQIVASVELCGVDRYVDTLREAPATDCYIYVDNEPCVKDKYGKPLTEVTIEEALSKLQQGFANTGYRRYQLAISMLQGFILAGMNTEDFVVLQYGH